MPSRDQAPQSFWVRLGYRSKPAELTLYLLALSGLPLWDVLAVDWSVARLLLPLHVVMSLILFPLLVLPFWLSHRRHLAGADSAFLRRTGRLIEFFLILTIASGLWLVIAGNGGAPIGAFAHWAHLIVALPLALLVLAHSWRYGIVRWIALAVAGLLAVSSPAAGATAGAPLLLSEDGTTLYSANAEAGSVSRIARADGALLAERALGGSIERIAQGAGLLAATDPINGKVHLLDAGSLKPKTTVAVDGRPFGIVWDGRNRLFWIAVFEGGRLVGIDPGGTVKVDMAVAATPRGLALLSDGRLLVTHSLIGEVTVFDTAQLPPKPIRTIALAHAEDPVQTVSQGLPRLLDLIAVSPDETEAWLPHVLWNFDHPFQFQSTIFPAVSVLSLEAGNEHEAVAHRKQLFQQINVLEDGNRTRIVSNPLAAAFSEDGSRVYVTASGSEDLLVFDRSRGASLNHGERRARRAGKTEQGGAKAVQIYRHLPGDNPRGLVVAGRDIYVQNAMSLDINRLDAGEPGPFATVELAQEKFAALVSKDPLPEPYRRGLRLFNSANTDDFPETPMAGDFWMSCQSCHVDGFNFTNGALLRDTPLDKFADAVPGHRNMKTMVGGDFVGDYLRMVRDTQGGMGADTRFGTPVTDPDSPSPQARAMMEDLHKVVTAPHNLPFLSTWLRLDDPGRRTVHASEWINSAACAECHSEIFNQWSESTHRLMGSSHPYYRVVEDLAAQTEGEGFRLWCMGCHEPQTVLSGGTRTEGPSHMLEKDAASLRAAHAKGEVVPEEGTGCMLCHRITRIEDAAIHGGGNTSFTVNLKDREAYVFESARDGVTGWLGRTQINAKPEPHAQSYSQPFYKDSRLCATCHGEFAPGTGATIVDTYGEWAKSPYNAPNDPAKNRTCMDCHMHADIARIGQDIPGVSTDGGKVKANVVTHQFTGANHHLAGLRNDGLARMSVDLLRSAARLSVTESAPGTLALRVANVGAGHALPTGVADFRELWLDVTVTDAAGTVVLRSGEMGADGALPADARLFRKVFGDRDGKPVGLRFWRQEKMLEDTRIAAGAHRDETFALAPGATYPLKVEARLMFRTYPSWVTDAVRRQYPEMPPPQPVEMTALTQTVEQP